MLCGSITWMLIGFAMYATTVSGLGAHGSLVAEQRALLTESRGVAVLPHFCCAEQKAVILPWMGLSFFGVFHILVFNALAMLAAYTHVRSKSHASGQELLPGTRLLLTSLLVCRVCRAVGVEQR